MAEPEAALRKISAACGIAWDATALEYFNFEHHITSGNHATIASIREIQGTGDVRFRDSAFYTDQVERMRSSGARAFKDERWQSELGPRERFFFDALCGARNLAWGYPADRFTTREVREFGAELDEERGTPVARARILAGEAKRRIEPGLKTAGPRLRQLVHRLRASPNRLLLLGAIGAGAVGVAFLAGWWVGSLG